MYLRTVLRSLLAANFVLRHPILYASAIYSTRLPFDVWRDLTVSQQSGDWPSLARARTGRETPFFFRCADCSTCPPARVRRELAAAFHNELAERPPLRPALMRGLSMAKVAVALTPWRARRPSRRRGSGTSASPSPPATGMGSRSGSGLRNGGLPKGRAARPSWSMACGYSGAWV